MHPAANREELLARCRAFEAGDGEAFHRIVLDALIELGTRQYELARYLKVTSTTVGRWARKDQLPQPRLQALIVRDIARRISQTIRLRQASAA